MKHLLSIIFLIMLLACNTNVQEVKHPDSYNYKRGVEALQNNNMEKALKYLNKELEGHADNGYALFWIAVIRNYREEYGKALTAANRAIKQSLSKDIRDVTCRGLANCLREEGDYIQALQYIGQAIQLDSTYNSYLMQKANIISNKIGIWITFENSLHSKPL